ncbi:alpha/beta fold hydrolase [Geodermatophilus normandii]|uniref:Alpha/beta fold hydrolase n=1 Tax=Geodermatophilus normandii TaxID=1137989 RepID=A0A6P0GLW4_9ACTN|nr:alpha/beta fold hydrolase [Geodermatophilus normandii]
MLLHGVGTSGWMWRRLVDAVGVELHLLVVDLPGHGDSAGRPWVSLDDTVAAVAEVIGRSAGGRAHVVGLSLGGYVATDLAARHPGLVPSALVSGVNVLPFPRPGLMRVAGRLMSPFLTTTPLLRANARALGVPAEDFDGYAAAARSMAPGTFTRVGAELVDYRVPEAAAVSDCRVLAVAGDREQELVRRSLPVVSAAFPRGEARVVPGVGHAWNGEQPALFADVVRAHVAGTELPRVLREPQPAT